MEITIVQAQLRRNEENAYEGSVEFAAEGHSEPYELTLFSKSGKEWMYSLHFARKSGREEDIDKVEAWIEEDDEGFDRLIDAAMAALS